LANDKNGASTVSVKGEVRHVVDGLNQELMSGKAAHKLLFEPSGPSCRKLSPEQKAKIISH